MLISKRGLQITLGGLWLLDGLLQLQHQMFTASFANTILAPAADGQPGLIADPMHLATRLILTHPAVWNSLFALTQLLLGVGLWWLRTVRLALYASIGWALGVWYLGEGFSGLLSGHASLLMGAPGAALLYAVLALAALPTKTPPKPGEQPARWLGWAWCGLWLGGAVLQLLPGQNSLTALGGMIANNANGAPGWLAALDMHLAHFLYHVGIPPEQLSHMHMSASQMAGMSSAASGLSAGYWIILLLAVIQASIGLLVLKPGAPRRAAVIVGIVVSLVFWVIGQSLGTYYSGVATDPNTAPLVIVLGLAVLSTSFGVNQVFSHLERRLT